MRANSITIDGKVFNNPFIKVEFINIHADTYVDKRIVSADVIVTDGVTGNNTLAILSLRVDAITTEAVEQAAMNALTA